MQQIVFFCQIPDRREESRQISPEEEELTKGGRTHLNPLSALNDDDSKGNHRQQFHRREEEGVPENALQMGILKFAVDSGVLLGLLFLPATNLNHLHATDRLLSEGVQMCESSANLSIVLASKPAEDGG